MPQSSIRKRVLDKVKSIDSLANSLYSIEYIPKSGRNKNKLYEQFYKGEKLRLFSWFKDVAERKNNKVYKKNKLGTLWEGINLNNLSKEGDVVFRNGKKPLDLMNKIISMVKFDEKDIILDFFSGSATTAHAVLDFNSKINNKCRFIMVQVPEIIEKNSENVENFNNICELAKTRIWRAGDKIVQQSGNKNLDIGFKVFKLDSSNLNKWDPDYENLEQTLLVSQDNIKEDRTQEDLIYEIMLKYGIDLTLPIEEHNVGENTIYSIGFGALLICLDDKITKDICNAVIELSKDSEVRRVVFKDNGFASDSDKTNIKETLRSHHIDEFITI